MFITSCENPRMAAYRDAACSPEAPLDIDADWLADDLFICPSVKGRMNRQTQWMVKLEQAYLDCGAARNTKFGDASCILCDAGGLFRVTRQPPRSGA